MYHMELTLSDKTAYPPCKELHAEQEIDMSSNELARTTVCANSVRYIQGALYVGGLLLRPLCVICHGGS